MNKKDIEIKENESGLLIRRPLLHPVFGKGILERRISPKGGLLGSNEACAYLGVSLRWLQQLVKNKKLNPMKKRGYCLFKLSELKKHKGKNGKES